jgi:hypothetical protein
MTTPILGVRWPAKSRFRQLRTVEANYCVGVKLSPFGADAVLPVGDYEPDDSGQEEEFYAEVEAVEDLFEAGVGVPLRAELHADVGEDVAPGPGADEGVDVEAELVHLRDAGGEGDEGADDGKHASDEDGDGAVFCEEVVDEVEVAAAEEHHAAVAFDHGASAASADPVGGDGAEVGGEGCDRCEDDELELVVGEGVAGEGHDDFGGNGDAGGLDRHEDDDAGVAAGADGANEESDDFL